MSSTLSPAHPLYTSDEYKNGEAIVVSVTTYAEVVAFLKQHQKINAIKAVRKSYASLTNRKLSLRSAKWAVERLQEDMNGEAHSRQNSPILRSSLSISGVVVTTGSEKVEVDLEELQLRILSEVQTIGLAECGRILELVEVFQAWNRGDRVGVIHSDGRASVSS